jgi:hypothetical protein
MGNHFFFVDTTWSTGTRPVGKTVDPFGVEAIDPLKWPPSEKLVHVE